MANLKLRERAAEVVDELLVNAFGDKGERLSIIDREGRDNGGWGRTALIDRLEAVFERVAEDAREDLRKRYRMVPHDFMEGNRG